MPDGMNVDIEQLSKDLDEAVTEVRKTAERLEEKHDGLDVETVKKLDGKIEDLSQQIADFNVLKESEEKTAAQLEEVKEQMAVLAAKGEAPDAGTIEKASVAFAGMLRKAEGEAEYKELMGDVIDGIIGKEFKNVGDEDFVKKTMTVGNDGNGGYLAPTEFGGVIMGRIFETSPVRAVANVMTTSASEIEFVLDDDEPDAGWVGEVNTRGDTDTPSVGQIIIPAHEIFAQPKASQKLLDDSGVDIEAWLAGKVSRKFSRVENTAFVTGDGSQKAKGFLAYAAWAAAGVYERNAVEQINSGTSADFDGDSFKDLQNGLIEDYQGNAVWMMKRSTWANVTKLKDTSGRYLFETFSNFRDGDQLQILGRPVRLADDMPAQAANSLSVVIADFNEFYTVVDRIGIRVLRDPFTSKPFVKFYTTKRTGGAVTNYEAGKIMKLAV